MLSEAPGEQESPLASITAHEDLPAFAYAKRTQDDNAGSPAGLARMHTQLVSGPSIAISATAMPAGYVAMNDVAGDVRKLGVQAASIPRRRLTDVVPGEAR